MLLLLLGPSEARDLNSKSEVFLPHLSTRMDSLASCGYETFHSGPQTLFAGRDQQVVGFVEFTLSSAGISVTYTVTDSRCTITDDVHVNIVNTQLSRVSPGRFPCKRSVPGSPTSFFIECPASLFIDLSCCETLLVYTHGVLDCGTEQETVYSGTPACSGRQWCNAVSVEPPCECECLGSACVQPQDCAISSPGSCDSGTVLCPADCAPPPQIDCGGYPTSCTFELVCDASECEPVTPCVDLCPPEGVCPNGPATLETPAVCTAPNECSCGGTLTCGDPTDPANCPVQPIVCDSTTCSPGMTLCPDDCGAPNIDCGGYPTSCTFDLVCDASECEPVTPCVGLCPPEGVCPSGPATPEVPAVCTSPNECSCGGTLTCGDPTDPANCPVQPIVCDSTTCSPGMTLCPDDCGAPNIDCGGYPTSCTFDLVCDASECEPVTPCVGLCPPEGVCPNGPATPEVPAVCTSPNECSCGGTLTCGDPNDSANCPTQPIVCDSNTCNPGETLCADDCGMPSDCGLGCLEPIIECPSDCPACPVVCECPNCFLPDISTGVCQCIPDPTVDDSTCNPCEGASMSICQDAGLPNSFAWYVNSLIMFMSNASCLLLLTIYSVLSVCSCPVSSGCKQGAIPDRIGVTQAELAVSFICSSSCGESCDVITGGVSRVCSLFGTINLGVDGNASTDDVIGVCPDLTVE
ncbi:hypothetical protein FGB62_74g116 [Gracilaria domingensis]|nr:hypothetical protein FGB62_74g116 [Gracilaria domingensis]